MNNLESSIKNEWLSLDDFVSDGNDSILYVRVCGEGSTAANINPGDVAVVDRLSRPCKSDLVLWKDSIEQHRISEFTGLHSDKLRLISRNGKTISNQPKNDIQIIGIVTHVLKPIKGGAKNV